MRRVRRRNRNRRFVRGATKFITLLLILLPLAVFTLPSLSVAVTTTKRGTMNWARMILPMLPSSMTAVGLRTLTLLAALPVFMSLMMSTDVISLTHFLLRIGWTIYYHTSILFTILLSVYDFQILQLYLVMHELKV